MFSRRFIPSRLEVVRLPVLYHLSHRLSLFFLGARNGVPASEGNPNGCGSTPMGSHFGVGAPPNLEPILVGIGMFTGVRDFWPMAKFLRNPISWWPQAANHLAHDTAVLLLLRLVPWSKWKGLRRMN